MAALGRHQFGSITSVMRGAKHCMLRTTFYFVGQIVLEVRFERSKGTLKWDNAYTRAAADHPHLKTLPLTKPPIFCSLTRPVQLLPTLMRADPASDRHLRLGIPPNYQSCASAWVLILFRWSGNTQALSVRTVTQVKGENALLPSYSSHRLNFFSRLFMMSD